MTNVAEILALELMMVGVEVAEILDQVLQGQIKVKAYIDWCMSSRTDGHLCAELSQPQKIRKWVECAKW